MTRLILLACLFIASISPAAESQLSGITAVPTLSFITNGSFEEGDLTVTGWISEGGARRDSVIARTGKYSAYISRNTMDITPRWVSDPLPCRAKAYIVSGWIATDMAAKADFSFAANIIVEFITAAGGIVTRDVIGWSNGRTGWQYRVKKVIPAPQAASMRIVFEFSKDIGMAWLDDVCVTAALPEISSQTKITKLTGVLSLDIKTSALAGNIFEPGEPVVIRATIRNATNKIKEVRFKYQLVDFEGRIVLDSEQPAKAPANADVKLETRLDEKLIPCHEYLELQCKILDSSNEYDRSTIGIGILPRRNPTGPSRKSYFGLLNGWPGSGDFLAQRIGSRWDRPGAAWNDRSYDSARRYGIETVALISGTENVMNGTMPLEQYIDYVKKTVERYKGIIKYYQIGNEPDVCHEGMPEKYVNVLKAAYKAAKKADPGCKIVAGGITELQVKPTAWTDLLKAGIGKYCDIYDHHVYYNLTTMEEMLDMVNRENKRYHAVKPQFMTETAASPPIGISEQVKAAYIIKRYTLAIAKKIDVVFWHVLMWQAGGELDQVGLMNPKGGYPWVSFFTFAAMTRELDGAEFQEQLNFGDGIYAIKFDHKTHNDLVLWSDKGDRNLVLKTGDGDINISEINGRKTACHTFNGTFTVTAGFYPLIITIPKGQVNLIEGPPLLRFVNEEYIVPIGGRQKINMVLYNSTKKQITGSVVLSCPGAMRVSGEKQSITVAPGESRDVVFEVSAAPGVDNFEGFLKSMLILDSVPVSFVISKVRVSEPLEIKLIPVPSVDSPAVRVSVKNLRQIPMQGKVRLITELTKQLRPEQFTAEFPEIYPGNTHEVIFRLSATADMQSVYNIDVEVQCQDGMTASAHEPLSFAPCYYAETPPVIDGDLSEWKGKMPLVIPYKGKWEWSPDGKLPSGPDDLSARIGTQWDENHFYLAVEVRDDIFRNDNSDGMMWNGDGLQFTIDPDPKGNGIAGYYEYAFAKTPKGNQFMAGNVPVGKMTGFWQPKMAIVRKDGITCYELALDSSQVEPLKLQKDNIFGFALIVNEQDESPRSFYGWYSGIGVVKAPDQFGRLIMTK